MKSGGRREAPVSVVVLSHNRCKPLRRLLDELLPHALDRGFQIIVVDNASVDGSKEMLQHSARMHPRMRIVLNRANLGVAPGRNCGYRLARAPLVLNLDDDTFLTIDDIDSLAAALIARPDVGVLSPAIFERRTGRQCNDHGTAAREVGNFAGCCYIFRRTLLNVVGMLDEGCVFGGEELEYSIRVRAAGLQIAYEPAIRVTYEENLRRGKRRQEAMRQWLSNYIRIHFKFFPIHRALLLSTRYAIAYLRPVARDAPGLLLSYPALILSAFFAGRTEYRRVPPGVVQYYCDPATRPDLGNVPLRHKLLTILRNRFPSLYRS